MIRRQRSRVRTLWMFYRRHLRVQPLRELMAVAGVAAGVALLFAVQVNKHSISGSFAQIIHGVAGNATLEVASRSPEGFSEGVYEEIARMPDVKAAAPLFEQPVVAVGPRGARPLRLVGATEELAALGGPLIRQVQRIGESATRRGLLVMTAASANAIGVTPGQTVALRVGSRTEHIALDAVLPSAKIGALAEAPLAAAPLPVVQVLGGRRGQLTRVVVEPRHRQTAVLRNALERRLGSTLNVRSIENEPRLLAGAAAPESELTALFSVISLAVGIILAYNALLLASAERRRFVVYLVQLGTPDSMIIASLVFDALVMGLAGAVIGLLAGDVISVLAYRAPPGYLTAAFPIGGQRVIGWQPIAMAVGAGLVAALAAAALPAIRLLRSSAEAEPEAVGRALSATRRMRIGDFGAFAAGVTLMGVSVAVSLIDPAVSIPALVGLTFGLVLSLPLIVRYLLRAGRAAARYTSDPAARLASGQLQTSPTLPVALLATGAIAVFLMVTIGGSIGDVQRAVRVGAAETGASAPLWVRPGGAENIYATQPFPFSAFQRRLARVTAVREVIPWRASFLDLPGRRVWVIGVPPEAREAIAPSQVVSGSLGSASHALRVGGWALISQVLASKRHLRLGDTFTLPTPSGNARLRLAGTIANYGWLPGTVLMNGDDYARLWQTSWATQLAVTLREGVSPAEGKRLVERALPTGSALRVQTDGERQAQVAAVLGSTLSRLSATTIIVLLTAIASVIAMMVAAVWQRRGRLDSLMSIGMSFGQLARLVFYESGTVLLGGCLVGMGVGILGQYLAESSLHETTGGSTVPFSAAWPLGLESIAIAGGISALAATIAVLRTVRFQPRAAFSTE